MRSTSKKKVNIIELKRLCSFIFKVQGPKYIEVSDRQGRIPILGQSLGTKNILNSKIYLYDHSDKITL